MAKYTLLKCITLVFEHEMYDLYIIHFIQMLSKQRIFKIIMFENNCLGLGNKRKRIIQKSHFYNHFTY